MNPARRHPSRFPASLDRPIARASLAFATLTLASIAALATDTPSTTPSNLPPAVPDVTASLLRIGTAMVLVLALFFGGIWICRNWQRLSVSRGRPARLRVLEARSLGARHALYVVAYDRERLLVASSPTGITLLDRLPAAAETEPPPAEPPPSFASLLRPLLPHR
jgi:flagellar biogenesis protein FliO